MDLLRVIALLGLLMKLATAQDTWWVPVQGVSWQYQLSDTGSIPVIPGTEVYVIDIDTAREAIPVLRKAVPGVKVVCYFSAGSYEAFRKAEDADRGDFSIYAADWNGVIGKKMDGWQGERWIDIRSVQVRDIMTKRMQFARNISCDGVDPDNVDGYTTNTGFPLTKRDQIKYNRWTAAMAHKLGLGVGLKNTVELVGVLKDSYDWFINESCFTWRECDAYDIVGPKNVFGVQYCDAKQGLGISTADPSCYCQKALAKGWNFLMKKVELDWEGISCAAYCASNACPGGTGACDAADNNVCNKLA